MSAEKAVLGWREWLGFPELGIARIKAKVDTGARSSALHVDNLRELPRGQVAFDVVLHRRKRDRRVHVKARIRRRGRVRSSTGYGAPRVFVSTTLRLGDVEKEIEIGLVDRGRMIHRMLLGRTALSGPFFIDVDRRYALGAPRRRRSAKRSRA